MGIPDHLTCLLRNLYAGQEATVTTGHGTDWFQIGKRVCQGCILSLCLFNFYAEYIMRNTGLEEVQAGIKITGRNINNFRYADDQRRQRHPTPAFFPGKSNGRRSLVGCSPWGRWESDKTQRLHFHFSLSCIGEGNGNPLQCSCLENPRHGGAWWASVYGVAQSRTRLKRLSSSSSSMQMTQPLWQKVKKNSKASWWKWKRRVVTLA